MNIELFESFPHGSVVKYKYKKNTYIIYDKNGNECAQFLLEQGNNIYLKSLKFSNSQKECGISTDNLLSWLISLKHEGMKKITLEDASIRSITGGGISIEVDLTRYRKFTEGVGWYEKYGFVAEDITARRNMQLSFQRFRTSNTDDVAFLIWTIVRSALMICETENGQVAYIHGTYIHDRIRDIDKHVEHHAAIVHAAAVSMLLPIFMKDKTETIEKCKSVIFDILNRDNACEALVDILRTLGLSRAAKSRIIGDYSERKWLHENVRTTKKTEKCIASTLVPTGARRIQKKLESREANIEFIEYIEKIEHFLKVMEDLGVIIISRDLVHIDKEIKPQIVKKCRTDYTQEMLSEEYFLKKIIQHNDLKQFSYFELPHEDYMDSVRVPLQRSKIPSIYKTNQILKKGAMKRISDSKTNENKQRKKKV